MRDKQINQVKIKYVLAIFIVIFVGLEALALNVDSHYKYDIPMCAILLYFIYLMRDVFHLNWVHYSLFAMFLVIHCLGMFDFYELYPLGIEYDYWVHGMFGFISSLIILRSLKMSVLQLKMAMQIGSALIIVLGISAAHELYEFAGAILLGKGEGVLFIGAGDLDQWDTQKDMLNNVIGGLCGIFVSYVFCSRSGNALNN